MYPTFTPTFFERDANDFLLDFDSGKLMFGRILDETEAEILYNIWRDEIFAQAERYAN